MEAVIATAAIFGLLGGALLISTVTRGTVPPQPFFSPIIASQLPNGGNDGVFSVNRTVTPPIQLEAIVHYATTKVVPQQHPEEIAVTLAVLRRRSPCNFLVFGLGHDSLMWAALNPMGRTVFLEEDPKWVVSVLRHAPMLRAHAVNYHTKLSQAHRLLSRYFRGDPDRRPATAKLRPGETRCKLSLTELPEEVYSTEWDLIMIDAPRGYFPEAPGRMAAIFSAAVMARNRKGPGATDVFLHDINRRVERQYAESFLCRKYLVKEARKLWHFEIPAVSGGGGEGRVFC